MATARIPQSQRPTMKVILVGNSGVGKTCLIASFNKESLDFNTPANVAPAYSYSDVRNSQGITVRLQIWDTAGQEKYLSVNQLFYRDSDVALVCFEACDQISLDSIKDWVHRVRDQVPQCELVYVITKSDLKTKLEIDQFQKTATSIISQFGGKKIFVTSALTREGVVDVFNFASDLYKPKSVNPGKTQNLTNDKKKSEKDGCCK